MLRISLLFTLSILTALSNAQTSDQQIFDKLRGEETLSQGSVYSICQDLSGYIWIGTKDGLNRYDGYNIKIYRNHPEDSSSISCNTINTIFNGADGYLWIGTSGGGLNKYDPVSDKFTRYVFKSGSNKYYGNILNDIVQDSLGNLWIGTFNDGLIKFNTETGIYERFLPDLDDPESISGDIINTILLDSKGRLWIGIEDNKLNLFIPETQTFKKFEYNAQHQSDKYGNSISSLIEDADCNIWIGTNYGGFIYKFDTGTEVFTNYREGFPGSNHCFAFTGLDSLWMGSNYSGLFLYEISNEISHIFISGTKKGELNYNTIRCLYNDRDGNLWIGTDGKGINLYSPNMKKFHIFMHKTSLSQGLSLCSVRAIYVDDNDFLWIGGYRISDEYEGFSRIDLSTHEIINYDPDGVVYCILPDKDDKDILWLGTEGQGIIKFNTKNFDAVRYYQNPPFCQDSINGVNIYCMLYDDNGIVYIGTEKGLNIDNANTKTCTFYAHDPKDSTSINLGSIKALYIDSEKNIWVGSDRGGFAKFDPEKKVFTRYMNSPEDKNSLSGNNVNSFYEDSKGRFWIGTDRGLNLMDKTTGKFSKITVDDGLPNDVVYSTLEDENGDLWLSTNMGLCKFNADTREFVIYDKNDGLPANEFNSTAYFKDNDGRMFFGGTNGLVSFYPSEILQNKILPQALITSYFIDNIETQPDSIISLKQRLIIKPDENIIGFEISAMCFLNPEKCEYKYKLENFMDKWIDLGNKRMISFTNLDPGKYNLLIKSSNNDGIWNDKPTKLQIEVLPHFYETLVFKLIMALLIIGVILIIYYGRIRIIRQQKEKLKIQVLQRTNELSESNKKLHIAITTKDKLYSIIAHDLKSPFNSLMGFSDLLIENWKTMEDSELIEIFKILKKTSSSTYDLLVNLLEWSQFQSGYIEYNPQKCDFNEILNNALSQLKGQASCKNISLKTEFEEDLYIYVDVLMINSILRNLISNAIKFTPKSGHIEISVIKQKEFISCCIHDNGVGISKEVQQSIFSTGDNISRIGTDGEKGTGLGLILCKEFIQKSHGTISVESEVGEGSKFTFTLPLAVGDD